MPIMNFDLEDGQPPVSFSLRSVDAERFMAFMNDCNKAADVLRHIAEIDGPIECTSLQDWQRKVKAMAANAAKNLK